MWKLICEMGGNIRVKSLDAYDIKNNVVDENSKEILMQSNNIIYEKIQSHFKILVVLQYYKVRYDSSNIISNINRLRVIMMPFFNEKI